MENIDDIEERLKFTGSTSPDITLIPEDVQQALILVPAVVVFSAQYGLAGYKRGKRGGVKKDALAWTDVLLKNKHLKWIEVYRLREFFLMLTDGRGDIMRCDNIRLSSPKYRTYEVLGGDDTLGWTEVIVKQGANIARDRARQADDERRHFDKWKNKDPYKRA